VIKRSKLRGKSSTGSFQFLTEGAQNISPRLRVSTITVAFSDGQAVQMVGQHAREARDDDATRPARSGILPRLCVRGNFARVALVAHV
jgi:hypothetical protein